eukprot:jgi/Mesen1/1962/ME000147S01056
MIKTNLPTARELDETSPIRQANTQWVRPPGREMNPLIDMAQRVKEGLKNRRVQVELSHFGPLVLMVGLGLALALYTSGRELRHPQTFPSKKRRTCQLAEIDDPPEYERLGHRFYETSKLRKFGEEPFITRPSLRAFFMLPPVLPGDDKPALGGPPAHHRLSA